MTSKKQIPKTITYDYFKKHKSIRQYEFKKYSYNRLSKEKQKNRLNFFIVNMILLFFSLIGLFSNPYSEAINYLLLAFGFIIFGLSALLLGYLRSIIPLIIYFFIVFINFSFYELALATSNYILLIILMIIVNISIFYIIFYILKNDFLSKKTILLNYFYDDDDFIGIDLDIKNFIPIENYNTLLKISIDLSKNYNADKLNSFDQNIFKICEKNKYIFIAHKSVTKNQIYELYIATDKEQQLRDIISKQISNKLEYEYKIEAIKEDIWLYYLTELFPDDYTFLRENTKNFVNNLENDNFDFSKEYPLSFLIQFDNKRDALKCKRQHQKYEYEKAIDFPSDNNQLHYIAVQTTTKLGLQRCLKITKDAYDFGIKYNGIMIEWRIGELVKVDEITTEK